MDFWHFIFVRMDFNYLCLDTGGGLREINIYSSKQIFYKIKIKNWRRIVAVRAFLYFGTNGMNMTTIFVEQLNEWKHINVQYTATKTKKKN